MDPAQQQANVSRPQGTSKPALPEARRHNSGLCLVSRVMGLLLLVEREVSDSATVTVTQGCGGPHGPWKGPFQRSESQICHMPDICCMQALPQLPVTGMAGGSQATTHAGTLK
jgi:hypothetical protein